MRPFRSFAQLTVASAAITLALSVASALAGTPSELSDLVGARGSSGFSNLWLFNRRTGQCVQLETAEGKVMTINEVKHPKCR